MEVREPEVILQEQEVVQTGRHRVGRDFTGTGSGHKWKSESRK